MTLQPTPSGTIRLVAVYSTLAAFPFALLALVIAGPMAALMVFAVVAVLVGIAIVVLIAAGWFRIGISREGIQVARGLGGVHTIPWSAVRTVEVGTMLGFERVVRIHWQPGPDGRSRQPATMLPFLYARPAAVLRDALISYRDA